MRRPIDNLIEKSINFLPKFQKDNYMIEGTQIIPVDLASNPDHIIMENFQAEDY